MRFGTFVWQRTIFFRQIYLFHHEIATVFAQFGPQIFALWIPVHVNASNNSLINFTAEYIGEKSNQAPTHLFKADRL
jgi:hypothetical protein